MQAQVAWLGLAWLGLAWLGLAWPKPIMRSAGLHCQTSRAADDVFRDKALYSGLSFVSDCRHGLPSGGHRHGTRDAQPHSLRL